MVIFAPSPSTKRSLLHSIGSPFPYKKTGDLALPLSDPSQVLYWYTSPTLFVPSHSFEDNPVPPSPRWFIEGCARSPGAERRQSGGKVFDTLTPLSIAAKRLRYVLRSKIAPILLRVSFLIRSWLCSFSLVRLFVFPARCTRCGVPGSSCRS